MGENTLVEKPWGRHLIMDMSRCESERLSSSGLIEDWIGEVLSLTGMEAFDSWRVRWGAMGDPLHEGPSVLVPIQIEAHCKTSHISMHLAPIAGLIFGDVFTCSDPFPYNGVVALTKDRFRAADCFCILIDRWGDRLPTTKTWSV